MYRLVETIKLQNGRFTNLTYHQQRFETAQQHLFGVQHPVSIQPLLQAAWARWLQTHQKTTPVIKCRFEYDTHIHAISFEAYTRKKIHSLRVVQSQDVEYTYKSTNRQALNLLLSQAHGADEVLICKNGQLTDTSFTNILLFDGSTWVTPRMCLLRGTKRQALLDAGIVAERDVPLTQLSEYQKIRLVNAMIDFEDAVDVPIEMVMR